MSALETQVGGDHYKKLKIQPVEYCMANKLDMCQANVVKYITRFRDKNGLTDLKKAIHFIELLIEHEYGKDNSDAISEIDSEFSKEDQDKLKSVIENDEWIDWDGGKQPCASGVMVEVMKRSGCKYSGLCEIFDWSPNDSDEPYDIIKYRIISPSIGNPPKHI